MHSRKSATHSNSGSSLVLVLLITALLATIAVSFLSTSRVEMMAARNFSRQNAAAGLAEMATQQAMAQIQRGFTINGTGTRILTTQPGAIRQFVFIGGNITSNTTTELFSGTGNASTNGTVNLNNLQNPSSNSSATSNQFTITGNRLEQIVVPMENITSNGTIVGRIAYYVDDEGTKLNVNNATGNRTTLNAAIRPQDIAALVSSSAVSFSNIINNSTANTGNITGWSHFFRPEQVVAAVSGISGNHTPFLSTATFSANSTANMTHLLTPWGSARLYINELPITTTGVNRTFTALTGISSSGNTPSDLINGQALQNLFGGNFSIKYTDIGVKQIAANMLQMRDPNTATVNASFSYNGSLLGSLNVNATTQIPNEYLGYAPYPVITEVGVSVLVGGLKYDGWGYLLNLYFCPTIEISNPYPSAFNGTTTRAEFDFGSFIIDEVSFDIEHGGGLTQRYTWSSSNSSRTTIRSPLSGLRNPQSEQTYGPLNQASNDPFLLPDIPAFAKIQYAPDWGHWWSPGLPIICAPSPGNVTAINNITNCTVTISTIKIKVAGNIRDWVSGVETGPINCQVKPMQAFPWNASNWPGSSNQWPIKVNPPANPIGNLTDSSSQRIDWLRKTPISLSSTLTTANTATSDQIKNWTTTNSTGRGGGASGNASTGFPADNWTESQSSWINTNSTVSFLQANYTAPSSGTEMYNSTKALPSISKNATIPSDPSYEDRPSNAVYGNATPDMREPFLVTGNYTSPSDLGLVPTNQRWRRLRMQMQPRLESSFIPDWAILDVISFGNSANAPNAFNRALPVNINGMFHLPGNATISPRTIGVKALAQVLSLSGNATSSIQDTTNPSSSLYPLTGNATQRFKGLSANSTAITDIATAIGNMTWSANSTWGNATSGKRWKINNNPIKNYILPSEIMEISGVADAVSQTDYNNSASHFKWNEGRASALIPAVTTRSSFFTIYAYAQALDKPGNIDSEALTKTMVEVEMTAPATATAPAQYKVKKLYTQSIPLGQ